MFSRSANLDNQCLTRISSRLKLTHRQRYTVAVAHNRYMCNYVAIVHLEMY